ncbi:glycosyltransferase [Catellatospora bangladeshensis]|uniref:Glycosyl transferase n=1 Tax=Catellatospora bangladeshensis TaxID=310355 RepID=A0A8J3JM10_9ACTN|nr:glycosyltransferase [Catellatospora bangladeshensis]GIF83063.1 glycosyl transferase [Catellatospora bangladeshensis]
MPSFLFTTWDGGGNVPPVLGVAARLHRRGHQVRVLGHPQQRAAVEAAGLPFEPYRHAGRWSATAPTSVARWSWNYVRLFTSKRSTADVIEAHRRSPADVMVLDCMLLGPFLAAQRLGVPHVALMHTVYGYLGGSFSSGAVGFVGRLRGMGPTRLWGKADLSILAGLADLDEAASVPSTLRYAGPVWPMGAPAPVRHEAAQPRILISLSTIFYAGQTAVLQAVLDAVADLPVQVVLTTGHATAPEDVRAPANVEVHRFVPHAEILPTVSLVVGHAGHSTTMLALAHDLPMVLIPMSPLGDQPDVARAVAGQGAAEVLARSASVAEIRAAITRMLADGPHRDAAARLGAQIRAADGADTAADLIEQLA